MSIKSSNTPAALTLALKPSRWLRGYLFVLALLGVAAALVAPSVWYARAGAVLAVGLGVRQTLRAELRGGGWRPPGRRPRVSQLRYHDGEWLLLCADERSQSLQLREFTLWPQLVLLRFHSPEQGRAVHFALWPDSCDPDELRRLRVILRTG